MTLSQRTWLAESSSIFLQGSPTAVQIWNETKYSLKAVVDDAACIAGVKAHFSQLTSLKPLSWSSYVGCQPSRVSAGGDGNDQEMQRWKDETQT